MPRRVTKNVDEFIGRIRDHRTNMVEDLAAWKISTFKWRRLAMALAKNRSMLFFVLRGDESMFHRLRPSVVRYLGNMLTINTYLISIDVAKKAIADEGCMHFARALRDNKTLTHLDISYNGIGEDSLVPLCESLQENEGLTELNLAGNDCPVNTCLSLARALKHNQALTTLDLSHVGLETAGVMWIAKGMILNRTLTSLNLEDNKIGINGALALADAALRNDVWALLRLHGTLPLRLLQGVQSQVVDPLGLTEELVPEPELRDEQGRLIDADGNLIDEDGNKIDEEGNIIERAPRAGSVASRSHVSATRLSNTQEAGQDTTPTAAGKQAEQAEQQPDEAVPNEVGDAAGSGAEHQEDSAGDAALDSTAGQDAATHADQSSGVGSAAEPGTATAGGDDTEADERAEPSHDSGQGTNEANDDTAAGAEATMGGASDDPTQASGGEGGVEHVDVEDSEARPHEDVHIDAESTIDFNAGGVSVFGDATEDATTAPLYVIEDEEYQWLDLADLSLGVEDLVVIGRLVWYNSTATALDLSLSLLAGDSGTEMAGVLSLCEAIKHNTTLTLLDLQETGMADVCAVALAEAVTHSQTLRLIRFDESELPLQVLRGAEPQAILELRTPDPDAVKKDRGGHTRRDSFTSNVSDSRSHRSLVDDAASHFSDAVSAFADDMSEGMEFHSYVSGQNSQASVRSNQRMRLGNRPSSTPLLPLTIRESRFVGEVLRLQHNTHITTLDGITVLNKKRTKFYNDDVMYHQVVMIGMQLRTLTTLKILDLSSQEIGPLGALVLSTNLAYNMALQRLIMHHADIRAAGAMYIASAIRRQRINTIRELDISWNNIGDEGALAIARALADLPQLKSAKRIRKQLAREKRQRDEEEIQAMIGRSKHLRNWMKVGQDNTRPEDLISPNGQLKRLEDAKAGEEEQKGVEGKGGSSSSSDNSDDDTDDDDDDGSESSSSTSSSELSESSDGESEDPDDFVGGNVVVVAYDGGYEEKKTTTPTRRRGKPRTTGSSRPAKPPKVTKKSKTTAGNRIAGDADQEEEEEELTPEEARALREKEAEEEIEALGTGETSGLKNKLQLAVTKFKEQQEHERLPELKMFSLAAGGKGPETEFATHLPLGIGALRTLHLRGNHIGEIGLVAVGMALGACKSLTSLSLSWNAFTEVACKALAKGLETQGRLQQLEMECCDVTPNAAVHLAYAISQNPSLRDVTISANPLNHPFVVMKGLGVVAMAAALYHDTCGVENLRLRDCKPDRVGTRALAQLLMYSTKLKTLDLSCSMKTVYLPTSEVRVEKRRYERLAAKLRRKRRQDQIAGTGEVTKKLSKSKAAKNAGVNLSLIAEECEVPFLDIDEAVWDKLVRQQEIKTKAHIRASRNRAMSIYSTKSGALTARSGALTSRSAGGMLTSRSGRSGRTAMTDVSRAETMAAVAAAVEYDLALDSAEFRVTHEEETMYGIADKLGIADAGDYGMGEDPEHGLIFTKAGRQIDPKNVPKKHRRGSLSENLKRLFGKRAIAQLDGEDTRKKAGFEYGAFDGNLDDFHEDDAVPVPLALGRDNSFLLARGLAANTSLTVLALRGNMLGNDGASAFGRVLDNNLKLQSNLTVLDVSKNNVSAETAFIMAEKMKSSRTFKHFDVRDNGYDERTKRDLRENAGKYMAVHC